MELNALDPLTKLPRVRWSSEMRAFLCCLIKYFNRDPDAFQAVFNSRFKKELSECGFNEKMSVKWSTLNSQWVDMKKKGDPIWGYVHQSAFDPKAWLTYIEEIKANAISINKHIDEKAEDTNFHWQLFQPEISPDEPRRTTEPQNGAQGFSTTSEQAPLCSAGEKSCFWCYAESLNKVRVATDGLKAARLPPLLYRWWNVDSQGVNSKTRFVAGLFSGLRKSYFAPDTVAEDEFCRFFESHIRTWETPSPFISTFNSVLAPLHRSLRNREGASIAIFNSKKLKSKVYSARDFVREHDLKIETYNGAGEYLVWGQISDDAIVCSFKVTTLLRIATENPDINEFLQLDCIATFEWNRKPLHKAMARNAIFLDKRAGATVGKLLSLLEVPQEFCRDASERMAYSFRVKTRSIPWRDFFQGVKLGYRGEPVMLTLPTPDTTPNSADPIPFSGLGSDPDVISVRSSDDESDWSDGTLVFSYGNEDGLDDADMDETPPHSRRNGQTNPPPMDLNEAPATQPPNTNPECIIVDSSDEEVDEVKKEPNSVVEELVEQEQTATDIFAVDRARVFSALYEGY
ncbi:hypothetical protein BDW75DRAFT_234403 [Aspergillus navahoensis]